MSNGKIDDAQILVGVPVNDSPVATYAERFDDREGAADVSPRLPDSPPWWLDIVVERTVTRMLDEFRRGDCVLPCQRMEAVEAAVFGRPEAGVTGLCERMHVSESRWSTTRRFVWTALGVFLTGCGSVIVLAITKHL